MMKMNLTNNQTAFTYALYMIASSYFDKAVCRNPLQERNMLLQYKEQKLSNQYDMEDLCIAYMDELQKKLPESFFKQNMTVHFRKNGNRITELLFVNRQCILEIYGVYKGKKSVIDCRLWVKNCNPEF